MVTDETRALELLFAERAAARGAAEIALSVAALRSVDALPMLRVALKRRGEHDALDPALRDELDRAWAVTTAHNLELVHESGRVLGALAGAGVPVAPLKGVALFQIGVYRDAGARPTADLDIVTRPSDRARVTQTLLGLGYAQDPVGGPKHLPPFVRGSFMVEVHEAAFWDPRDGRRATLDDVLSSDGAPRLEATVAHVVHHLFEGSVVTPSLAIKTLWDLAELRAFVATRPGLAARIAGEARAWGLGASFEKLAGALARLSGDPGPPEWAGAAEASVDAFLRACAPRPAAEAEALRLTTRLRQLWRHPMPMKLAILRAHLLPSREGLERIHGLPPGSPWVYAHYAARPARLAWTALHDAATLVRARLRRPSP